MSDLIVCEKEKLIEIADAIRAKTGSSEPLGFPSEFAPAIEGIIGIVIPDGSDIVFGNQNGEPVEREEAYSILSKDLNAIGAIAQKMAGRRSPMTVADMIYWLNRVQFIPQGNAESELTLSFNAAASGILPNVQKGTATSVFSLSFTASAVGELQEG